MSPRRSRWLRGVASALLVAVGYALITRLLTYSAFVDGWPENHEGLSPFQRVEVFRRAFAARDWLPVWTPFAQNGHGSPLPLFYHRLFSSVAGLIALKVGAYKATKFAVWLFVWFGALGMHRAARTLGTGLPFRCAAGVLFASAPYLLTDWLVRGAVAELAAMALTPWFLSAVIRFSRGERVGLQLGVWAALLFYAHSMIAFFALLLPVTAGVVRFALEPEDRVASAGSVLTDAARFAIAFLLLTGPVLAVMYLVRSHFGLHALEVYDPTRGYPPISRYLADSFEFGAEWRGLSIEVGRGVLALLVAVLFGTIATRTTTWGAETITLGVAFVVFAFLQLPVSAALYRAVPGALLLQFPWRLLVFLVPIAILLACALGQALARTQHGASPAVIAATGLAVIVHFLFALGAQKLSYGRVSEPNVVAAIENLDGPNNSEYLPVGVSVAPARRPLFVLAGCTSLSPLPEPSHIRKLDFEVEAARGCVVEFSQFCSPLIEIRASRGEVTCTSQRTSRITIPPGAPARITVARKGLFPFILSEIARRRPA